MGLESSQFISGLQSSWPTGGDPKSQGDDHIRLIKGALQATFPNASRVNYFPETLTQTSPGTVNLTAAHQNATLIINTSGGGITVNLPALDSSTPAWSCNILKYSTDQGRALVYPPSNSIFTESGYLLPVRVGATCSLARFFWSGNAWFCLKSGPPVGTTQNFDGPTLPGGHLVLDGSSFNTTEFAELNAALGTNVLHDKRGRVEAGVDSATGRLGNVIAGGGIGALGGVDLVSLIAAQLPSHTHSGTTGGMNANQTHSHTITRYDLLASYAAGGVNARFNGVGGGDTTSTVDLSHGHPFTTDGGAGLSGAGHGNVQPTIITQKIIRAC